jgi:FkbM family methyltransferase
MLKVFIKKIILKLLKIVNLTVLNTSNYNSLKEYQKDIVKILEIPNKKIKEIIKIMKVSKSELFQETYVLFKNNFKKKGYFVEFGAKDGIDFSNTLILEKKFNWKGILAEPAKIYHSKLKKNRPNANICTDCVYDITNSKIDFYETRDPQFSTIQKYKKSDAHIRIKKNVYQVKTISLLDLLKKYQAPKFIDYLSIDTEGSEFEILNNFDFKAYQFKIITVEHNFTNSRDKIYNLLIKNGYKREFVGLSKWDDWYYKV